MYCQNQIEDNGECTIQCEHCKKYYAPLELEEVADKFAKIRVNALTDNLEWESKCVYHEVFNAFICGAKHQAEIMYSKEDVVKIVEKSRATGLTAEYLIEQFKKNK